MYQTAQFYDKIYSFKNYQHEATKLHALVKEKCPDAKTLLDVACGTGEHARYLKEWFDIDGLDLDQNLLDIASIKNPTCHFTLGDMRTFQINKKYDVITCLFSAIGYLTKAEEVVKTLNNFRKHLNPNGLIIVEPWFTPEAWKVGVLHMLPVDEPDLKICRMNISERIGNLSKFCFEYLIGTKNGIKHIKENHELALYSIKEMKFFFEQASLNVYLDEQGIYGRGLYIAKQ
jgi:ubiquinone/menaquinone biosynthesis C-methylase UbiE